MRVVVSNFNVSVTSLLAVEVLVELRTGLALDFVVQARKLIRSPNGHGRCTRAKAGN